MVWTDIEVLGTSPDTLRSGKHERSYSARSSPPHSVDHMLVFPSGSRGSLDSN